MTGPKPPSVTLDLLYLVLEHVLLVLAEVDDERGVEVILIQARDLQHSVGAYWRGQLESVVDDPLPF